MNCREVQLSLSLYLYGELDFSQEEDVEGHLNGCASCQKALAREKSWHTSLNGTQKDVPLDLLAQCRRDIRATVTSADDRPKARHWRWGDVLGFRPSVWSARLALASFLLMAAFGSGRWVERHGFSGQALDVPINESALIGGQIRDIQPSDNNQVRITVDQVQERQITGGVDDQQVRQLLFAAAKSAADPGIRVNSVEILDGHGGMDVRDALLNTVRHDSNAAVRLKALDGLRQFANDPATQNSLEFVLEHDRSAEVRSEAIEVLAPVDQKVEYPPDFARVLRAITRSQEPDEYVRGRCFQILGEMRKSPRRLLTPDVY